MAPVVFCWCLFYLLACNSPMIGDKTAFPKGNTLPLVKDTLHLRILTVYQNMISSSGVTSGVLGSLYDPYFGSTYAGFYAQYTLASSNVYFGPSQGLDSVVLTLQYSGYYGDPIPTPVDVYVYQLNLNQGLVDTQNYFTNTAFQVTTPPIGKRLGYVPYNLPCGCSADSVTILGITYPQHLRIDLSKTFGNSIINPVDSQGLTTTDSFYADILRGLYVTVNTGKKAGNGMEYFDLTSVLSGVTVYYHNATGDSLTFTLPISGASVNHFDNIYNGTPAYAAVSKPPPNGGSETLMYVQAGGGLAGEILIPGLDSLPKNIAVNKAEIVLTVQPGDTFTLPSQLSVYRIDDAGQQQILDDATSTYYGGLLEVDTLYGPKGNITSQLTRYRFNMPIYFQKLVKGVYRNNGLQVASSYANTSTERVVIANSPTNRNYQVTFDIIFTKL